MSSLLDNPANPHIIKSASIEHTPTDQLINGIREAQTQFNGRGANLLWEDHATSQGMQFIQRESGDRGEKDGGVCAPFCPPTFSYYKTMQQRYPDTEIASQTAALVSTGLRAKLSAMHGQSRSLN